MEFSPLNNFFQPKEHFNTVKSIILTSFMSSPKIIMLAIFLQIHSLAFQLSLSDEESILEKSIQQEIEDGPPVHRN